MSCTKELKQVCGTDKKTYGNSCLAECKGLKFTDGACKVPNPKTTARSCSAEEFGDNTLKCGDDCTPECAKGEGCTEAMQYCQTDGTCGMNSMVKCADDTPTTRPAPGSKCKAGTPPFVSYIKHCGQKLETGKCSCKDAGKGSYWSCQDYRLALSPCQSQSLCDVAKCPANTVCREKTPYCFAAPCTPVAVCVRVRLALPPPLLLRSHAAL